MIKIIIVSLLAFISLGCAQTIDLRASHFAVPVVSNNDWSPQLHGSFTSNTSIGVLSDYTSNPPIEGNIQINANVDWVDVLLPGFKNIGLDGSLSLKYGFEAFLHGSKIGLRWQFLNHGEAPGKWVSALHVSTGSTGKSLSQGDPATSETQSVASTNQVGVSVGYTFDKIVPYFSYILENHDVKTDVKNSGGDFGPYKDKGEHTYYTMGITAPITRGFVYTLELSGIGMNWNNSETKGWQNSLGLRLGYSW